VGEKHRQVVLRLIMDLAARESSALIPAAGTVYTASIAGVKSSAMAI
jgi:hypothetical protein